MQLTPREVEKLMIYTLSDVAFKRKARGLKLNYPEAVSIITVTALEGARDGKTVEDVMTEASKVLTKNDVMEGVSDLIPNVQVEAIFTDGSGGVRNFVFGHNMSKRCMYANQKETRAAEAPCNPKGAA